MLLLLVVDTAFACASVIINECMKLDSFCSFRLVQKAEDYRELCSLFVVGDRKYYHQKL
jgi:hypothetical protein